MTQWPPYPTYVMRGRAATPEDTTDGLAAFAVEAPPQLKNRPLDIPLPILANFYDEYDRKIPIVLVQAEIARQPEDMIVVGYQTADGAFGACTLAEVQLWHRCVIFFRRSSFDLEAAETLLGDAQRDGDTLLVTDSHDAGVELFIRYDAGSHVTRHAVKSAVDTPHEGELEHCNARFDIFFEDLEVVLDEINTLIDVQATLQDATKGFCYCDWNDSMSPHL